LEDFNRFFIRCYCFCIYAKDRIHGDENLFLLLGITDILNINVRGCIDIDGSIFITNSTPAKLSVVIFRPAKHKETSPCLLVVRKLLNNNNLICAFFNWS
jgi:hypothetical protein